MGIIKKDILNQMDATDGENNKWLQVVITAVAGSVISIDVGRNPQLKGKLGNHTDTDYNGTVKKTIKLLKQVSHCFSPEFTACPLLHLTEH